MRQRWIRLGLAGMATMLCGSSVRARWLSDLVEREIGKKEWGLAHRVAGEEEGGLRAPVVRLMARRRGGGVLWPAIHATDGDGWCRADYGGGLNGAVDRWGPAIVRGFKLVETE
jgi:hypothetical protein